MPPVGRAAFCVLLPSLECNLSCGYCFQAPQTGRWTVAQARTVIGQILDWAGSQGLEAVHLHWQGGEPLVLGHTFWQAVLPMAAELSRGRQLRVTQAMQTNLIGYESPLATLVHEHLGGRLGSSFELVGLRALPGPNGAERFVSQWLEAFDRCQRDGITVGVLYLLNEETLQLGAAQTLERLHGEFGLRHVRFTLPFRQRGPAGRGFWLDPEAAGRYLAEVAHIWRRAGGDSFMQIKPLSHLQARLAGETPTQPGTCEMVPNCSELSLAVLPNGEVTLCDNFAHPDALGSAGNVFVQTLGEIREGPSWANWRRRVSGLIDEECVACRYLPLCFGGCLAKSRRLADTGRERFHYCATYQQLFRALEGEG